MARFAGFRFELALHHHLRGDARVVYAGHPQRVKALGPLEAGEYVVQGEDQRVAHVQVARDVGRRNHNGPGRFAALGLGLEDLRRFPLFVPPGLGGSEIKSLVHIAHAES